MIKVLISGLGGVLKLLPSQHRMKVLFALYTVGVVWLTGWAVSNEKNGTFENIVANYKARAVSDSLRIAAIGGELDAITAELYKCHDKYNAMGEKAQSIINKIAAQSIEIDKLEKK